MAAVPLKVLQRNGARIMTNQQSRAIEVFTDGVIKYQPQVWSDYAKAFVNVIGAKPTANLTQALAVAEKGN